MNIDITFEAISKIWCTLDLFSVLSRNSKNCVLDIASKYRYCNFNLQLTHRATQSIFNFYKIAARIQKKNHDHANDSVFLGCCIIKMI